MRSADYFSASAEAYATFRPTYPDALIGYLASVAPGRDLAWDCATGNGQAALPLTDWFARVVATDASATQLAHARPHPGVEYRLASAAASGLSAASVDLVTVAQALHWLDLDAFYAETQRVLKPDGVLAAWCYARCRVAPDIDPVIDWFYQDRVGRYWPPERVHTETGYRNLPFPFEELPAGRWEMTAALTRAELVGYFGTWSAVAVARRTEQKDPIPEVVERLAPLWPSDGERRQVTWPLALRIGRARRSPPNSAAEPRSP
jgi:SAM-dependent methyltransferase